MRIFCNTFWTQSMVLQPSRPVHSPFILPLTAHSLLNSQMETFHLFHLSACHRVVPPISTTNAGPPLPPTSFPPTVVSTILPPPRATEIIRPTRIYAAAAHMVFAARETGDFITPDEVNIFQEWAARGCLDGLVAYKGEL